MSKYKNDFYTNKNKLKIHRKHFSFKFIENAQILIDIINIRWSKYKKKIFEWNYISLNDNSVMTHSATFDENVDEWQDLRSIDRLELAMRSLHARLYSHQSTVPTHHEVNRQSAGNNFFILCLPSLTLFRFIFFLGI